LLAGEGFLTGSLNRLLSGTVPSASTSRSTALGSREGCLPPVPELSSSLRVIESLRLEKTSKMMIKSNRQSLGRAKWALWSSPRVCRPMAAPAHTGAGRKALLWLWPLLAVTFSLLKIELCVEIRHFCTQIACPVVSGLCLCAGWREKTFCLTALYSWEIIHRNASKILPIYFCFQAALGNVMARRTLNSLWRRRPAREERSPAGCWGWGWPRAAAAETCPGAGAAGGAPAGSPASLERFLRGSRSEGRGWDGAGRCRAEPMAAGPAHPGHPVTLPAVCREGFL